MTGDAATLAHKVSVLRGHCAEVGRDPAEVAVTWMSPLILTSSEQNTIGTREMLAAAASATETAGFTIGQAHEIAGLVAGHSDDCRTELSILHRAALLPSGIGRATSARWRQLMRSSIEGRVRSGSVKCDLCGALACDGPAVCPCVVESGTAHAGA